MKGDKSRTPYKIRLKEAAIRRAFEAFGIYLPYGQTFGVGLTETPPNELNDIFDDLFHLCAEGRRMIIDERRNRYVEDITQAMTWKKIPDESTERDNTSHDNEKRTIRLKVIKTKKIREIARELGITRRPGKKALSITETLKLMKLYISAES